MKFVSLRVRGFGALPAGEYRFGDRTLVLEGNAAGKSTLAAALRAALYGLPDDRRSQRVITDHEALRPWRGDDFAISLELEAGGARFIVERDFGRQGGAGRLAVYDDRRVEVTEKFLAGKGRDNVGPLLAGVGPQEFERAVLAGESAWGRWDTADTGGLVDLLGRAVTAGGGGGTAAAALAACDEALRAYPGVTLAGPGLVDNEIKRLNERLDRGRARAGELERELQERRAELTGLAQRRGELEALDGELRSNRRRLLLVQAAAARRELAARSQIEEELARAQARADELAPLAGFPAEREEGLAKLAERAAQLRAQARFEQRRGEEKIAPQLAKVEQEAARVGPAAPDGETEALAADLGAARERVQALAEVEGQLAALRERIAESGESPELMARLHAGLPRLAETERQFLHEQQRVEFELAENERRRVEEETQLRRDMREWERAAARARRRRLLGGAVALLGVLTAVAAQWSGLRDSLPLPLEALLAAGASLSIAGLLAAVTAHRRAAALEQRRALQGEQRLARLALDREGDAGRDTVRRERLVAMEPVVLGRDAACGEPRGEFLQLYRRYDAFRNRFDAWFRLRERAAVERAELDRLLTRLAPQLSGGTPAGAEEDAALLLERGDAELRRRRQAARLRDELASLSALLAGAEAEQARLTAEAERVGADAALLLQSLPAACRLEGEGADAAVDPAALLARDPRAAAQWFSTMAAEARELERLRARTIPELEGRLGALPPGADSRAVLEAVARELGPASAVGGGLDDGEPAVANAGDLIAAGERLRRRRDALAAQVEAQARELAEFERRRREEAPRLSAEMEAAADALDRALRYRDAVTLARVEIERLGAEVYHQWALRLEEDAALLVARLCPEITALAFTPELDYRVTLADGRLLSSALAERQLSAGQRDQIVLAIRLALSRFLGRAGDPLPLVLDDPFARYDDQRFARAMRVLCEEVPAQQIILMTTQAVRLSWLAQADPEAAAGWSRLDLP